MPHRADARYCSSSGRSLQWVAVFAGFVRAVRTLCTARSGLAEQPRLAIDPLGRPHVSQGARKIEGARTSVGSLRERGWIASRANVGGACAAASVLTPFVQATMHAVGLSSRETPPL